MALTPFDEAIQNIDSKHQAEVDAALYVVCSAVSPGQIRNNVISERGLKHADFGSLLQMFAEKLHAGSSVDVAWLEACRAHQFRGDIIPAHLSPKTLGRVKTVAQHAVQLASTDVAIRAGMTPGRAKELIRRYAAQRLPPFVEPILRAAPLGKFLIWATFDENDPSADPFSKLPSDHAGLLSELGLGMLASDEALIVLVWDHHQAGSPALYRPTVADAADYTYFRPSVDVSVPWGRTFPLNSSSKPAQGMPEVIMGEVACKGLRLPYLVIDP